MRTRLLTVLGCLIWLIFFAAGIRELLVYGLYVDGAVDQGLFALLGVPLAMIAGTVVLGHRTARGAVPGRVIAASSLVAGLALLFCLAALARWA